MKIVTMCQGGHVRSVALKYLLHYRHGHDCLAIGWESTSEETRNQLFAWADAIVILQPEFEQFVAEMHKTRPGGERKLFCYDVGPDRFGSPFHPELQAMLISMLDRHQLFHQ